MSQLDMLKEHFVNRDTITGLEAQFLYRIMSLPRRIKDLEEQEYVFEREWKKDITGHRYKVYTIVSDENVS
tara:strand:+ start:6866 stop:7078 length:213 start_codon:yes stop_codon:yes gene_type:complete